jgi:hypothetical protein
VNTLLVRFASLQSRDLHFVTARLAGHVLTHAVFINGDVFQLQILDDFAVFIAHRHIHHYLPNGGLDGDSGFDEGLSDGCDGEQHQKSAKSEPHGYDSGSF